jgi:YHS domain-containing protein
VKKLLVILLAIALFAIISCGGEPEQESKTGLSATEDEEIIPKMVSETDPVDGKPVGEDAKYRYVYLAIEYRFNSKKNYEAFKENPEKYIKD